MQFITVILSLTVLSCIVLVKASKPLPKYITACKRNDPNLNECAVKSASAAVASLVRGDPEYKTPNLMPMKVQQLELKSGDNLKLTLKDVSVLGLEGGKFTKAKLDLKGKHLEMTCYFPWVSIDCQYTIDGAILVLPISGSGAANLTFSENYYTYSFDYDLVKKDDGKEYVKMKNSKTDIVVGKSYFYLENLFNGNKELGDHMNNFLNENSDEVVKDLGIPVIAELVQEVITLVLRANLDVVPYDSVFPE